MWKEEIPLSYYVTPSSKYTQFLSISQKHADLQCKLQERIESACMQIKNIQMMRSKDTNNEVISLMEFQVERVQKFIKETVLENGNRFLLHQTEIEEKLEKLNLLQRYETRIKERYNILYDKEVDISVGHVLKEDQNPNKKVLKKFDQMKSEMEGIHFFAVKVKELKNTLLAEIELIEKENENQLGVGELDEFENKEKLQSESATNASEMDFSDANPEEEKEIKTKKLIVLGTEQRLYQEKEEKDPQILKFGLFLREEKEKETKLRNEYENLKQKMRTLHIEKQSLLEFYQKRQCFNIQ